MQDSSISILFPGSLTECDKRVVTHSDRDQRKVGGISQFSCVYLANLLSWNVTLQEVLASAAKWYNRPLRQLLKSLHSIFIQLQKWFSSK